VYIGWCDGVQAHDGNVAHMTCHMPRSETTGGVDWESRCASGMGCLAEDGGLSVQL